MSNQSSLNFSLRVEGDNSSTTLDVDLWHSPLVFSGELLSDALGAKLDEPTGVTSLSVGGGISVTGSITGHILSLTFSAPFAGGNTVTGVFLF